MLGFGVNACVPLTANVALNELLHVAALWPPHSAVLLRDCVLQADADVALNELLHAMGCFTQWAASLRVDRSGTTSDA